LPLLNLVLNRTRVRSTSTAWSTATHELRAVQDMLGHHDPNIATRYARVVDRAKTNPALKVPVDL
jgi:integrase